MQTFVEQLAELPLFSDLSANQLHRLLEVFEEHRVASGEVLFEAGSAPSTVWLLVKGSLSVRDTSGEVLQISPPAQVGELSALTGEDRNLSAVAATPCALLGAPVATFQRFLEANGAIAFVVHRNLLRVAARKLGRDRRRLTEMRDNIKGTQRAMKIMRDALLESEDTPGPDGCRRRPGSPRRPGRAPRGRARPPRPCWPPRGAGGRCGSRRR
jgi:CRP-like cAMP-binding protein